MPRLKRIKRRVLREAVRENVDQIHGVRRPPRRRSLWWGAAVSTALVLVPTGLLAAYLLAGLDLQLYDGDAAPPVSEYRLRSRPGATARRSTEGSLAASRVEVAVAPAAIDRGVLSLAVRKVVLDPGHGGASRGAQGPAGLVEKSLTLDIAERLRVLLEESAFQVAMTRYADEDVTLEDRAKLANDLEADIFVSIHLNWIETRDQGVETYFLGPTDDPYLMQLAAEENRGSGYSLADFRRLLEQVYVKARQEESRHLASEIHRSLFSSLREMSPGLKDRGVKSAPFLVLTGTEMPAVLAEVSCLSSKEETELLLRSDYRQYIAEALFDGIEAFSEKMAEGIEMSDGIREEAS